MRQLGTPTLSGNAYQDLNSILSAEFWAWPATDQLYWTTRNKAANVLGWNMGGTDLYRSPVAALKAVMELPSLSVPVHSTVWVAPNAHPIDYWLGVAGFTVALIDFDEEYMPLFNPTNGRNFIFVGSDDLRFVRWAEELGAGWEVVLYDNAISTPETTLNRRIRHLSTSSALNGVDNWIVHTPYGTPDGFPPQDAPSLLDLRLIQSNTEICKTNVSIMNRIADIFRAKINPRLMHPISQHSDKLYVTINCGSKSDVLEDIGYLYEDSRSAHGRYGRYQRFVSETYKLPVYPSMFDTDAERIAKFINQEYV